MHRRVVHTHAAAELPTTATVIAAQGGPIRAQANASFSNSASANRAGFPRECVNRLAAQEVDDADS